MHFDFYHRKEYMNNLNLNICELSSLSNWAGTDSTFSVVMVSSHWATPRTRPRLMLWTIRMGFHCNMQNTSHCTETDNNTDSHWVVYTCYRSRYRYQSRCRSVWIDHQYVIWSLTIEFFTNIQGWHYCLCSYIFAVFIFIYNNWW